MMMREEKKREKGRGGGEGGAGWGSRRSPVALSLHPPHPTPWPFFGSLSFFFFRRATTTRATATRAIPTRAASTRCEEEEGACARARERGKADGWTGRERGTHTDGARLPISHAPTPPPLPPKNRATRMWAATTRATATVGTATMCVCARAVGQGTGGKERKREKARGGWSRSSRVRTRTPSHTPLPSLFLTGQQPGGQLPVWQWRQPLPVEQLRGACAEVERGWGGRVSGRVLKARF